jgi:hypothetical protein
MSAACRKRCVHTSRDNNAHVRVIDAYAGRPQAVGYLAEQKASSWLLENNNIEDFN